MRRNKSATLRGTDFGRQFFAKIGPPWGTDFGKRGPFLAAKIGPAGPSWQQKWSGGTGFGRFPAKISPAGPILGGTDFGVTVQATIN